VSLFDDDVAAILTDLAALGEAVTVVFGGVTIQGIRDYSDADLDLLAELRMPRDAIIVRLARGALALETEDVCTVDAVAYTVRDHRPDGVDGRLTRYILVPTA
jgi:hypothetical protein